MRDEYARLIAFAERNLRTQIEKKQPAGDICAFPLSPSTKLNFDHQSCRRFDAKREQSPRSVPLGNYTN
jgi:hypothetical protein